MTTIAYHHDDKTISVDSRASTSSRIHTDNSNKIIKNHIGIWFYTGLSGDAPYLTMLHHNDKPDVEPDGAAYLIKDSKVYLVTMNDGFCIYCEIDYNHAIGSGDDFALAAMDFGRGSKDAVKYAMTRDFKTGGKVQTVKVK